MELTCVCGKLAKVEITSRRMMRNGNFVFEGTYTCETCGDRTALFFAQKRR